MKCNNEMCLPKPYHSSSIFWASLKKKENNTISDFRKKNISSIKKENKKYIEKS